MQGERTDLKYSPCERMRRARGWSQIRLAGIADVTEEKVRRLEQAHVAQFTVAQLVRISTALGCSVVDLVPGFAVRQSEGGRVQQRSGARFASREMRRDRARRMLLEVLREGGGRRKARDVLMVMRERYGVPEYYVRSVRAECGVEVVRLRGRGIDAWEWCLPAEPVIDPQANPSGQQ